jgi:3',5'-cyclic AMP phosphodiesterase CpdA
MSLRILLTSDIHLGMKFASLPDVQADLAEARFTCLRRLVTLANERERDLLVVAGDLFERISVPRRDVQKAAETLRDFQGKLAVVLPGNHDFLSPQDEIWSRFREACGDAVLVLDEGRPFPLAHFGIDACLYPGPCLSKHSPTNALGWIRGTRRDPEIRSHIGVAHGSLEGFSPDFNGDYYPMKTSELLDAGMDLWLLGHTHARYPLKPGSTDRIFYAGTPEPDGFDCAHEGFAWLLDIDADGALSADAVRTGAYRFLHEEAEIRGAMDLLRLEKKYSDAHTILLKATLRGHLPPETYPEVEHARRRLARSLFHLDWDAEGMREEISKPTIDREFPEGSFPHRLLTALEASGDAESLELAYEILLEARA